MTTNETPVATRNRRRAKNITGVVRSEILFRGCTSLSITNDVGGTTHLPVGQYRVRLLRSWYDYETGIRCIGRLLDPDNIAIARRTGTTGFRPDDYSKYGRRHYERTRVAAREYDPARVYFHLDEFTPHADGNAA